MSISVPNSAAIFHQAQSRHMAGDVLGAIPLYRQVLRQRRNDPDVLYQLGSALMTAGQTSEAKDLLTKALKVRPDDVRCLYDLALAFKREGRLPEARQRLQAGLKRSPGDPLLCSALSDILATEGRWSDAHELLTPLLEVEPPNPAVVQAFARIAGRVQRNDELLRAIDRSLADGRVASPVRAGLMFAKGATLDALGRFDEAFEAFSEANALRHSPFDPDYHSARISQMINRWSDEAVARLPRSTISSERFVFVVGMPRSGTSLIEQILASHPEIGGGGELNLIPGAVQNLSGSLAGEVALLTDPGLLTRDVVDEIGRTYSEQLARLVPRTRRATDKMPLNALHLGVIAAALPQARVIHCVRDPLDTCLSCFFQHFGGSNPFAYDLESLGRFHLDYQRLMTHWQQRLDLRMIDVVYEQLVADLVGGSRRMIEFLGLPWHDSCLRFHENRRVVQTASRDQVSQPIYQTSLGRWKHYERHLEPLRRGLQIES